MVETAEPVDLELDVDLGDPTIRPFALVDPVLVEEQAAFLRTALVVFDLGMLDPLLAGALRGDVEGGGGTQQGSRRSSLTSRWWFVVGHWWFVVGVAAGAETNTERSCEMWEMFVR